jgi:hypothetical protein
MRNKFPARGPVHTRVLLLAAALLALCAPATAQDGRYRVDQELSFGKFGISRNNAQYEITVDINGNYTADPGFVLTAPYPTNAELFLDMLTPSVPLFVDLNNTTLSVNGSGNPPLLSVRDFTTNGPFVTSAGGTLTVLIGATLRSSGTNDPYESGPYTGTLDITFDY